MKKYIYSILLLSAIGAAISGILVFQHYYPDSDTSIISCGDAIENPCIAVGQSDYSKLFGIPLAAYGLFFYLCIIFILLIADYAEANYYKVSNLILLPLITLSLFIDLILAGILIKIGEICLLCVSTYLINIIIFIITFFWIKKFSSMENKSIFEIYRDIKNVKIDTPEKKVALSSFSLFIILLAFSVFSASYILKTKTHDPRINKEVIVKNLKKFYSRPVEEYTISENGLVLGNPNAEITIYAFTDFLCSACYRFYKIEKYLLSKYKDKVKIVYFNFPLDEKCNPMVSRTVYKNSCIASRSFFAALKFGIFHEYLVEHFRHYKNHHHNYKKNIAISNLSNVLKKHAKDMSESQINEILESEEITNILSEHIEVSGKNDISSTPTLYIAGRKLEGTPPKEILDAIIKVELKKLKK